EEDLEGDLLAEVLVTRLVDDAHGAAADLGEDLVLPERDAVLRELLETRRLGQRELARHRDVRAAQRSRRRIRRRLDDDRRAAARARRGRRALARHEDRARLAPLADVSVAADLLLDVRQLLGGSQRRFTRSCTNGRRCFPSVARAFWSLSASIACFFSTQPRFTRRRAISMSGWRRPWPFFFRAGRSSSDSDARVSSTSRLLTRLAGSWPRSGRPPMPVTAS